MIFGPIDLLGGGRLGMQLVELFVDDPFNLCQGVALHGGVVDFETAAVQAAHVIR